MTPRRLLIVLALALAGCAVVAGAAVRGADATTRPAAKPSHAMHAMHKMHAPTQLAEQIADARVATAKYANNLEAAKADGWNMQITPNMPGMGYHFLNPSVSGFDVTKPPILVYARRGDVWQLVAFEWVFPETPAHRPLKGARYGSFAAACHYVDGEFIPTADASGCAATHPTTGAAFAFWHPDFVTLHLWLWYPNPDGIYNPTNPLVTPFNGG